MNTIRRHLDDIFSKFEETREINDLKEEIYQDLLDRYNEAEAEGKSEEEALKSTLDSMGDLESLLNEMHAAKKESTDFRSEFKDRFQKMFSDSENYHQNIQQQYSGVDFLSVRCGSADITLDASPDADIHIRVKGNADRISIAQEKEKLSICEDSKRSLFDSGIEIYIEIPSSDAMNCDIETMSGDLMITRLLFGNFVCSSMSGDIEIHDCAAENMGVKSLSGDIYCELVGSGDRIAVRSTSGDVEFAINSRFSEGSAVSVSGDVSVRCHCFDCLKTETASGDIDICLLGVEAADIDCSTVSGEVASRSFPYADENHLTAHSISGDIDLQ